MRSRRVPRSFEPNAWSARLATRRAAGAALLDLTVTDPNEVGLGGAGAEVAAALADAAIERYRPDPMGLESARRTLAADLASRGDEVSPADLMLTTGTSESYAHAFRLLCDPGDVVLAPRPSYPLFEPLAAAEGVRIESYRIAWDGGWHLDAASLDAAFAAGSGRVRAVIVVQPNHPTGSALDATEMQALGERCATAGAAIVSDEVFREFGWPGHPPPSSFLGARVAPTLVLDGLSKRCGMPQLKLGWIALAGPETARRELREGLEWIGDLFLSVAAPVQLALPGLLAAREPYQRRVHTRLAANRAALERFTGACPAVTPLAGGAGWAVVLRLPQRLDAEGWSLALLERDVVLHAGDLYEIEQPSCVVVSLLPDPGTFAAGLARLARLVNDG
ncbi:MAG: pyridoxal phosphate-dependent aminotransferase [Candidatus Eisenbacteria bacterium]